MNIHELPISCIKRVLNTKISLNRESIQANLYCLYMVLIGS